VLLSTRSSRCKRKASAVASALPTRNWEDAIKAQRPLSSSRPSRSHSFPPVLVMEAAENRASHDLAVLGERMPVVTLQR
jgi:hypothetical protein